MSLGARPRVLVVDDQESVRTLLCRLLDREGFEPLAAADGGQAVALFRTHLPLVVVSDVMMPHVDGLTLLREIKSVDRNAGVILMTGHGNEDVVLGALRGGATNFFRKPFNLHELVEEIRKVVAFRVEAARASLFSPFLAEERKCFVLPTADAPYFPIINQIALQLPCLLPEDEVLTLKVGIEEMITNAIEHGNLGITYEEKTRALEDGSLAGLLAERARASDAAGRRVRIDARLGGGLFEVTVADDGEGFDWRRLPALGAEDLAAASGRGIFLTRIYFDEVEYNERGMAVTLRKRARPRGDAGGRPS